MDEPRWELPAPIKVTARRPPKRAKRVDDQTPVSLILPDMQIAWYRTPQGKLRPTHDEAAIEASIRALEWLARRRPIKHVVGLGDNLDAPDMGKYRKTPSYVGLANEALRTYAEILGTLRSITDSPITMLEGNHDVRWMNYLIDNAVAAFDIRIGGDPDNRPALSLPVLLNLDELDIEYIDGYPSGELFLEDDLMCIHGHRHGQTAGNQYLSHESVSVVHGHTHRVYQQFRTTRTAKGARLQMAASPGTLARIDGAVPSTLSGTDRNGCPVHRTEPWEQAVGVVQHFGDKDWIYENALIKRGNCHLWGEVL